MIPEKSANNIVKINDINIQIIYNLKYSNYL